MSSEKDINGGSVQSVRLAVAEHEVDGDEALKAFSDSAEPILLDHATERRLLRRIDLMLMPVGSPPFLISMRNSD